MNKLDKVVATSGCLGMFFAVSGGVAAYANMPLLTGIFFGASVVCILGIIAATLWLVWSD